MEKTIDSSVSVLFSVYLLFYLMEKKKMENIKLKPNRLHIPVLEAELFELYYNFTRFEKHSGDPIYISVPTNSTFMQYAVVMCN